MQFRMKLQKKPTPKPIKNTQTVKDILFIVLINDKFDKQFPHVESQITVRTADVTNRPLAFTGRSPEDLDVHCGKLHLSSLAFQLTSNVTLGK